MHPLISRPAHTSGDGFLRKSHFQVAYVTNDLERARDIFSKRYGITEWFSSGGATPSADMLAAAERIRELAESQGVDLAAAGHMQIALAWAGETMYELIQAEGEQLSFYHDRLSKTEFQIRHHHFAYLIQDEAEFDAFKKAVETENWNVVYETDIPGYMCATYVEAPELGHYMEFVFPRSAEGASFLNNVPVN